jgi:amidase
MKRVSRSRENLILHFDGAAPPALTVAPGETFQVETADAEELVTTIRTDRDLIPAEFDENFVTPSTGPIYVEDAEPGDEVVVELIDIEVVPPSFTCLLKGVGLMRDHVRDVPMTRVYRIAEGLIHFDDRIRIPLRPMVGIVGTTPPEPIRVFFAGDHGGNIDDRNCTIGSHVHLPVYHPGALIALGDVHASQGDGETLMGVETDSVITARVHLIKRTGLKSVRVETPDRWSIVARADSMDDCVHLAALRAAQFLNEKLGLTMEEATLLMCAAVDFRNNSTIGGGYFTVMRAEIMKALDSSGRLSGSVESSGLRQSTVL